MFYLEAIGASIAAVSRRRPRGISSWSFKFSLCVMLHGQGLFGLQPDTLDSFKSTTIVRCIVGTPLLSQAEEIGSEGSVGEEVEASFDEESIDDEPAQGKKRKGGASASTQPKKRGAHKSRAKSEDEEPEDAENAGSPSQSGSEDSGKAKKGRGRKSGPGGDRKKVRAAASSSWHVSEG